MYDRNKFSERLKELRNSTEKTQKQFAELVESTPATISAYENGTKNPSLEIVSNIAQKCDVSLDWLCGLKEEKHINLKIQTYGDVIKLLIELFDTNLHLHLENSEFDYRLVNYDPIEPTKYDSVVFDDRKIQNFLEEWGKMRSLHYQKTIDDDLYNLWIEKTLNKYDIEIEGSQTN